MRVCVCLFVHETARAAIIMSAVLCFCYVGRACHRGFVLHIYRPGFRGGHKTAYFIESWCEMEMRMRGVDIRLMRTRARTIFDDDVCSCFSFVDSDGGGGMMGSQIRSLLFWTVFE